jgi:hypothetical protein
MVGLVPQLRLGTHAALAAISEFHWHFLSIDLTQIKSRAVALVYFIPHRFRGDTGPGREPAALTR